MHLRSMAARWAAISSLAITAACDDFALSGLSLGGGAQSLALVGGDVVAVGPSGYCVDSRASNPAQGFAAIVACASLSSSEAIPRRLAFMTLQVGEDGSAFAVNESTLRNLMRSAQAFDGVGSPDFSVDQGTEAALVVYRSSEPSNPIQGRAIFDVGERAAVLTLNEIAGAPLSFPAAKRLMIETLRRLRNANATNGAEGT